jgi:septum formation protein
MLDLGGYSIILGSKSPRRKELLSGLGVQFEIRTLDTNEDYPNTISNREVPTFLAKLKAQALVDTLKAEEILITSDTIVLLENEILGKPKDASQAFEMLRKLSGKSHEVITGVHLRSQQKSKSFQVVTKVYFKELADAEIDYYIQNYKPFDKAGSYGIQEWIGYIGISKIEGSYFNVVGLPVSELYDELKLFIGSK